MATKWPQRPHGKSWTVLVWGRAQKTFLLKTAFSLDMPKLPRIQENGCWLHPSDQSSIPDQTINTRHIGPEHPSNKRKIPKYLIKSKNQNDLENVSLKLGSCRPEKLGPVFSFFLIRKPLSSGQKWFLRPYFPLIRGMFLLRSGLRFLIRALEVPEPRVRKMPLSL